MGRLGSLGDLNSNLQLQNFANTRNAPIAIYNNQTYDGRVTANILNPNFRSNSQLIIAPAPGLKKRMPTKQQLKAAGYHGIIEEKKGSSSAASQLSQGRNYIQGQSKQVYSHVSLR